MGWANDSSSRRRFISDNAVLRVCLAKISVVPEPASIEIFCFLANSGPSPDAAKNKFPTNPKKKHAFAGVLLDILGGILHIPLKFPPYSG